MDISKLVNSEDLFKLELLSPVDESPLGITFMVRSSESDAVKKIVREHGDKLLASRKKKLTISKVEDEYLDKAAAAIASWDWGAHEWGEGKGAPVLSFAKAREVVETANWIYDQVAAASEDRANFTKTSEKPSAKR